MKSFTFNRQLLLIMFMLLNCFTSYASDDNLITKQTIINLTEAGTLQNKIAYSEKYLITNLKIIGEINGTDLCLIRDMAGSYVTGEKTPGKLSILDLSETKIVEGGDYYYTDYFEDKQYTKNDTLGNWTFAWCKSLTTVIIPTSIAAIGRGTFYYCSNLATIDIPSNVTEIGSSAFVNCSSLKSMNIPSSVKSIGGSAFYGCNNLTSINIPLGITEIEFHTFSECSSLTSIDIPSSVTKIGEGAFKSCSGLTSVEIPSGVTVIGRQTFEDCYNLTSVNIPYGVTNIKTYAFKGCKSLKDINIPFSVNSIEGYTFADCSSLTSVNIPIDFYFLGPSAFENCTELTSIYMYSTEFLTIGFIGEEAFKGCNANNCTVYVPKGTLDAYSKSKFNYFKNIVEFEATSINKTTSNGVKEISRYNSNGQQLTTPIKGINIIKYSDGSIRKVIVK